MSEDIIVVFADFEEEEPFLTSTIFDMERKNLCATENSFFIIAYGLFTILGFLTGILGGWLIWG